MIFCGFVSWKITYSKKITAVVAWMAASYGVGSVIGPCIAPFFLDFGPTMIFAFYGITSLMLFLSGFFLERDRV